MTKQETIANFIELFNALNGIIRRYATSDDDWIPIVDEFIKKNTNHFKKTLKDIAPNSSNTDEEYILNPNQKYRNARKNLQKIFSSILDIPNTEPTNVSKLKEFNISHLFDGNQMNSSNILSILSWNVNGQFVHSSSTKLSAKSIMFLQEYVPTDKDPPNIIFKQNWGWHVTSEYPHGYKNDGKHGEAIMFSDDFILEKQILPSYLKHEELGCRSTNWIILIRNDITYAVISIHATASQRKKDKKIRMIKCLIDDMKGFIDKNYVVIIGGDFNIPYSVYNSEYQIMDEYIRTNNKDNKISFQVSQKPTNLNLNHENEKHIYGKFCERLDYFIVANAKHVSAESVMFDESWLHYGFDHGIIKQTIVPMIDNKISQIPETLVTPANNCSVLGFILCDKISNPEFLFLEYNNERNQYNFISKLENKNRNVSRNEFISEFLEYYMIASDRVIMSDPKRIKYGKNNIDVDIFLIEVSEKNIKVQSKLTKIPTKQIKDDSDHKIAERLKIALKVFKI